MNFPTQTGLRPDLAEEAKLSQAEMGGYSFPKIFPVMAVKERAGTFAYAPENLPNGTGSAQEGRANGSAITSDEVKCADYNWTTARLEARTKIYDNEVKAFGGIEAADKNGGRNCVRRAYNKVEFRAYEKVFSAGRIAGATSLANNAVQSLLTKAAIAVRPFGSPYLYMTTNGLVKFLQIPEVRRMMFGTFGAQATMNLLVGDQSVLFAKLSPLLGFKGIVVAQSEIVGTTNDDAIAVIGLREEAFAGNDSLIMTAKERATYGFCVIYIPEGASTDMPFGVSSAPIEEHKMNIYDAESAYSLNELHGGAVKVFKMLADLADYSVTQSPVEVKVVNADEFPQLS